MIITIDGPAGTGKSSVTKKVGERLHMTVLDTGALYRALAHGMLREGIDIYQEKEASAFLKRNQLEVILWEGSFRYFLGDVDVTMYLRTQDVANAASVISSYGEVRSYLLPIQRKLAEHKDVVCEGRDMGTTVFPHADIKIYLTASPQERARRRFLEIIQSGITTYSQEQLEQEIRDRDERDSKRKISPLKVPEDAFFIDTSVLTLDQVVEEVVYLVKRKTTSAGCSSGHWEHFPHQSDIGIRGIGGTPSEAFEQAALALTAVITNPDTVKPRILETLTLQGDNEEALLVDWLNALLFEMSTKNMFFSWFHITLLPGFLRASFWGEPVNREKHQPAVEVKGATYHCLRVTQQKEGQWIAECVVDV